MISFCFKFLQFYPVKNINMTSRRGLRSANVNVEEGKDSMKTIDMVKKQIKKSVVPEMLVLDKEVYRKDITIAYNVDKLCLVNEMLSLFI